MKLLNHNYSARLLLFLVAYFMFSSAMAANVGENNLTANQLIYNKTHDTIIAKGNVKLSYNGNHATSDLLQYNKHSNKILAIGHVTLTDKNGNIIHSDKADLTKDLSSGFIQSLQAETSQNTYFTAKGAQRIANGRLVIFNNASYTACKSCDTKQHAAPVLWRIKAKQIIWNKDEKKLTFKKSHFDILGKKTVNLPDFTIPDYSVKRYSGFLAPILNYNKYLGYGAVGAYFFNLAPQYDLTLRLGTHTKQGITASGTWRHRLQNGVYDLSMAYVRQQHPELFQENSVDSKTQNRFMLGTKASYNINANWKFGWDVLLQSDEDFSHTYNIEGYNNYVHASNFYLEGLGRYNYFKLNFYRFQVQDPYLAYDGKKKNKYTYLQPWVLPEITYNYRAPTPIYDGTVKLITDTRTIYRTNAEDFGYPSLAGANSRLSSELSWEKLIVTKAGLLLRPILALRADLQGLYSKQRKEANLPNRTVHGLATAGLEIRYPILIQNKYGTQTLEPIAQIYLRNNLKNTEAFVNEDAQSLSFSALSLFQRDKFSGYDKIEYGSRANLGFRYYSKIKDYLDLYAIAGQSFQLSSKNPFSQAMLADIEQDSGLEHRRSDYVSMIQINNPDNLALKLSNRFDYKNLSLRKTEIDLSKSWARFSTILHYTQLNKNTNQSYKTQLAGLANLKLNENWQIGAYQNLDLTAHQLINLGSSLTYQNDCLALTLLYSHNREFDKTLPNNSFGFRLNLRTIMDLHNN